MKGFYNRILSVDVSSRTSEAISVSDDLLRRTLGGKGLATELLLEHNPPRTDPFGPETG